MPTTTVLALQEFLDEEDEELRRVAMATTGTWERGDRALATALRTVLGRGIDLEDRPPLLAAVRRELCRALLDQPPGQAAGVDGEKAPHADAPTPSPTSATNDTSTTPAGATAATATTRPQHEGRDAPARLAGALDRLPVRSRLLIALAHLAHLTPVQLGQVLGTDPGTVSAELEQARRELADSLAQQGDELVLPDAPVRREASFSREEGEMR